MNQTCRECGTVREIAEFPLYRNGTRARSKTCSDCRNKLSTIRCCRRCNTQKPVSSFAVHRPGQRRSICKTCAAEAMREYRANRQRKRCVDCERVLVITEFKIVGRNRYSTCKSCDASRAERVIDDTQLAARLADFYASKAAERQLIGEAIKIVRRDLEHGKTEWVVRLPGGATLCRVGSYSEALDASSKWLEVRA